MATIDVEHSVAGSNRELSSDGTSQGTGSRPVPRENSVGLRVQPTFCPEEVKDPFDTVDWDLRSAAIKDESGDVLFEQENCEIPSSYVSKHV